MYNHTIPLKHTPTQKNKLFVLKITIASWGAVIITFFSFSFFRSGFVSGLFILKFSVEPKKMLGKQWNNIA